MALENRQRLSVQRNRVNLVMRCVLLMQAISNIAKNTRNTGTDL